MGRLIELDVDKLKELLNDNKIELTNNIISIVRENYIPKTDYENRLKADMAVMLNKIRAELHATAEMHDDGDYYLRDEWIDEIFDEYKTEME